MLVTDDAVDLRACVRSAALAPSIHNTQPWKFHVRRDGVDVYADWHRRLDVIDPNGRQLIMSVGAAVMNLRLAVRLGGGEPVVRVAAGSDGLVASVDVSAPARADPSLDALALAIPRRHTNRLPFVPDPIPAAAVDALVAAATPEGATLDRASNGARARIIHLVQVADARLREQGVYRADLAAQGRQRVPHHAFGAWHAAEILPLRDFGTMTPYRRPPVDIEETHPAIFVLGTDGDTRSDWLRAGQAMERVWLTAVAAGLAIAPMSQPLELPELRAEVSNSYPVRYPQIVLLVGYAPPTAATPRRDLAEVLVDG
jgi:hypothetical protein